MYSEYFGEYIKILKVRSLKKGLGATTSYLAYCLDAGVIEGAIVVKATEHCKPEAVVARNSEELRATIGTKWVTIPLIDAIIDALRIERMDKVAIIGTPCQCQAIRDIKEYPMQLGDIFERITMIVGLFCMGSFTQDGFKTMLERKFGITLPEIVKADIKADKFVVYLRNGKIKELPIDEVKGDIKFACLSCDDFTAKSADISFGNAGSSNGWRSAIVRDESVLNLLSAAADAGYLEYRPLEQDGITEIEKMARDKAARAAQFK
ncbi:MAG: hypothetical protein GXO25_01860 [Euryarchaeota archaeon]|nr:hypothetical protein [Euryarchaeota archaeon]